MLIGGVDKKVWIFSDPVDMRKSYDGLYGLCREAGHDVLQGDLFLFVSRGRQRAKVLFWDGTGLNILMKRMEKKLFCKITTCREMSISELNLFLQGAQLLEQIAIPEKEKYIA